MSDVSVITFSPTHSSQRVAEAVAKVLGVDRQLIDLSNPHFKDTPCTSSVAVISVPVYAGRVPAVAIERLKRVRSQSAKAVTIVVYGNRAYEDALLELNDEVRALGFEIVASAAVVAQHSIVKELASERPNETDLQNLQSFARLLKPRIDSTETYQIEVPGNRPYRDGMKAPVTPLVSDACGGCRLCATQCPTGAISMIDPKQTDLAKCLLCMRCVSICPAHARFLPTPILEAMSTKLAPFAQIVKQNEYFL